MEDENDSRLLPSAASATDTRLVVVFDFDHFNILLRLTHLQNQNGNHEL